MSIYGYIYIIRNKINNKIYIGQTCRDFNKRYRYNGNTDIERVYKTHLYNKKKKYRYNSHLLNSIKKYGFDVFEIDKEFDVAYSQEELNKLEYMYIKIYNTTNYNFGYNKKDGGDNGKPSEETRKKLIEYQNNPNVVKRKKELMIGENNPFYGKHHTEETKNKISIANKNGDRSNAYKKIILLNTLETFNSITEASKKFNISVGCICRCCKNLSRYTKYKEHRYVWVYYEDYLMMKEEDIKFKLDIANNVGKGKSNGSSKKVICVTTNKIFDTAKDGARFYNCNPTSISSCCNGKLKHAGKLDDGTKLKWMKYDDYVKRVGEIL